MLPAIRFLFSSYLFIYIVKTTHKNLSSSSKYIVASFIYSLIVMFFLKNLSKRNYNFAVMEKKDEARTILIKGKKRVRKETKIRRRNNKVKVGGGFSSNKNPDFELVSKFLENASEDILLEIFLRLPNCRSAILLGSFCRRWHSVISHPKFIPNFIRHQQDKHRYSLPFTIIFRRADHRTFKETQYYQPFCKVFSEESKFLHGTATSSYLDFLPSPMVIRASFDDLLLVAPGSRLGKDYYICNPLTKQWFELPKTPGGRPIGFALVCMPNSSNEQLGFSAETQYQYKVVFIHCACHLEEDRDQFRVTTFCSKSGQWSRSSYFYYPRPKLIRSCSYLDVVLSNGILYWRETDFTFDRIVAFDFLNDRCRLIDFPADFGCGWMNSYGKVYLGAVRGELRLLQVFEANKNRLVMKVWELEYEDYETTSWVLIHELYFESANIEKMVGLAVHPNNGDVVFMICGNHAFEYKITENRYEKVGKLEIPISSYDRFSSIPLVHPAWPTPVPSHPSPI